MANVSSQVILREIRISLCHRDHIFI
jgi:hypothetical protein